MSARQSPPKRSRLPDPTRSPDHAEYPGGANALDKGRSTSDTPIVCRDNIPPADDTNDSRAGYRTNPATNPVTFTCGVPFCTVT